MTLDTRTMTTRILALKKNPDCPACGKNREEIVLSYISPVCGFVPEISVVQMKEREGYILIDVREQEEWDQGHIEGARLWSLSTLMQGIFPDLPQGTEIILHCQKGMRSLQAAQILKDKGFMDVASLSGGYEAWLNEN